MTQPDNEINSQALFGYLVDRGWRQDGTWRGAPVWTRNDSDVRLLVPASIEYPDDPAVLRRAVSDLATAENRTTDDVLRDIAAHPGTPNTASLTGPAQIRAHARHLESVFEEASRHAYVYVENATAQYDAEAAEQAAVISQADARLSVYLQQHRDVLGGDPYWGSWYADFGSTAESDEIAGIFSPYAEEGREDPAAVRAESSALPTGFPGQQPQFILRHTQTSDNAIRLGSRVHFLSIDHLDEPLYEVVAEPGDTAPAGILAHLSDRDTDQLWQLRDTRNGRTVHSDLYLQGWRGAEEVAIPGPVEVLWMAGEFGLSAHNSGIPPIPELDANYVTAVTLWPQVTDDLKRDWLGSWFESSYHEPGLWEDIDWTTELEGSRYAGMPTDQALTAASTDLEISIKAALPRHLLPPRDSVTNFLHGQDLGTKPALESVRETTRDADTAQPQESTALETALGPLTPPPASSQASAAAEPPQRPAASSSRTALPHQQQDQPQRTH
ncbi:hypothetical protein [Nocardia alni]|uniref:hypothetical protein n=1 Tax=Nocardia alni TaxID=2815723 RepID=UPI001C2213A0|nr:hypothetical protein [Nocardia alni]